MDRASPRATSGSVYLRRGIRHRLAGLRKSPCYCAARTPNRPNQFVALARRCEGGNRMGMALLQAWIITNAFLLVWRVLVVTNDQAHAGWFG
jgi:hypothetical protein